MALRQVYELPAEGDRWYAHLADIRDLRPDSPLVRLEYPQIDEGNPDGAALVILPSGYYVEIVEYGTRSTDGEYMAVRYGKDGDARSILEELLREANLSTENLMWSESDKRDS